MRVSASHGESGLRGKLRAAGFVVMVGMMSIAFVVGTSTPSAAHSALKQIEPRNGAVVSTPLREIRLVFNERVSLPRVVIRHTTTGAITGRLERSGDGRTITFRTVRPLPNGSYSVLWRVRSKDGHIVSGTSRFTVRARS